MGGRCIIISRFSWSSCFPSQLTSLPASLSQLCFHGDCLLPEEEEERTRLIDELELRESEADEDEADCKLEEPNAFCPDAIPLAWREPPGEATMLSPPTPMDPTMPSKDFDPTDYYGSPFIVDARMTYPIEENAPIGFPAEVATVVSTSPVSRFSTPVNFALDSVLDERPAAELISSLRGSRLPMPVPDQPVPEVSEARAKFNQQIVDK